MGKTITIFSTQKIEVIRDLAFRDSTPDLTKAGAIVSSEALIRVNTLKPISYQFMSGKNTIPDPLPDFKDPLTGEMISESILSWPGVKHLIEAGVFSAYSSDTVVDPATLNTDAKKKNKSSLDTIAGSTNK